MILVINFLIFDGLQRFDAFVALCDISKQTTYFTVLINFVIIKKLCFNKDPIKSRSYENSTLKLN